MADIKTKVRGTVKALDKVRVGTERLKENVISIKDKSEGFMGKCKFRMYLWWIRRYKTCFRIYGKSFRNR